MGDLHLRDFLRSSWIFAGQFFDSARSDPGNNQPIVGGTQKKLGPPSAQHDCEMFPADALTGTRPRLSI